MLVYKRGRRPWFSVVGVAKRLRRQVVALEIEGSNPSVHPNPFLVIIRSF